MARDNEDRIFQDREEAGRELAQRLGALRNQRALVLAIPRGAVPMGRLIADALGGELDVVLVRKLRAPQNPELAIGSIDESGRVYLDPAGRGLWTEDYLRAEQAAQLSALRDRRRLYGRRSRPLDVTGRTVIVVDDGIATGSTMIAALRAVRAGKPRRLVAAVGVAPRDTLDRIRDEADEAVCLKAPSVFHAVGSHFADFPQVSDDDVAAALSAARAAAAARQGRPAPAHSEVT